MNKFGIRSQMRDVSDLSAKIEIVKWEFFCDIAVGSRTP